MSTLLDTMSERIPTVGALELHALRHSVRERQRAARREMISGTYRPQFALHIAIVGAVVVGAVAVAVYLISA